MPYVNVHDAKTNLSKLIEAIVSGEESEIIIARNGKPAVRLVPLAAEPAPKKRLVFGVAKGKFVVPDDIDALNPEIEALFYGEYDESAQG